MVSTTALYNYYPIDSITSYVGYWPPAFWHHNKSSMFKSSLPLGRGLEYEARIDRLTVKAKSRWTATGEPCVNELRSRMQVMIDWRHIIYLPLSQHVLQLSTSHNITNHYKPVLTYTHSFCASLTFYLSSFPDLFHQSISFLVSFGLRPCITLNLLLFSSIWAHRCWSAQNPQMGYPQSSVEPRTPRPRALQRESRLWRQTRSSSVPWALLPVSPSKFGGKGDY